MRTVAGLLVMREERVLLVFKGGYWFFPGGKRETGEALAATLRRELMEELQLGICGELQPIHAGAYPAPPDGEEFLFHTFTCHARQLIGMPALDPRDTVKGFAWVDRPLELNLTCHTRAVLSLARRMRMERAA